MKTSVGALVGVIAFAIGAIHLSATHSQDPMERMRWATAELVHYDIVADYSAPTTILAPGNGMPGFWSGANETIVTDQFSLSFDWSPMKRQLVGKVAFKNSPSVTSAGLFAGACRQPPPITGTYEHLEVIEATPEMADLILKTKRSFPAGTIPITNDAGCSLYPVAASSTTLTHRVPVIPGTFIPMPALAPSNIAVGEPDSSAPNKVIVGKDGKTMVLDDSQRGWKYTYTLKITKEGGE